MKKLYYIETTLNGYIIKETELCDWVSGKDYIEDLYFTRDGEEVDYYNDIAGDLDDLDNFLKYADSSKCDNYEDVLGGKPNVFLEYWLTTTLGYYDDRYIGLMIK